MRGGRRTAVLVLLAASVAPAPLGAQSTAPSRDDRIRELQAAIGEASADEAAALEALAAVRARRAELDSAVAVLDGRVRAVETRVAELQAEIDRFTAAALALDAEAEQTADQLEDAQARLAATAAAMYRGESAVPILTEVLDEHGVRAAYAGSKYLSYVSEDRRDEVDALEHLKSAIEDLEAAAQTSRDDAQAARAETVAQRDELARLRSEQRANRDEAAREEQQERAIVASIQARKDEFSAELATLQASSNAITEMLAARQRGQTKAAAFNVRRPVDGPVVSRFGLRVHPILGTERMHNGIDMDADQGDRIRSGADGVVAFAGWRSGYGNTVIVDHGNQYATLYAHASALHVDNGERVTAGETIAAVGATGLASGPHLHFEVRLLGVPIDPAPLLR